MIKKQYTLIAATALTLSSCKKGPQEEPKQDYHSMSTLPTEIVENGDQTIKDANQRDAGFISNRANELTLTGPCFGAVNKNDLDLLPRPNEISKTDSTLIDQLNNGEVFLLQPGTKGIMLSDEGAKLLIRFQMGEVWVWKSATK